MLHGSHLEKVSTPDKIFMVDQLKTIQETQTDTHRAIKYHYKRGSIIQCSENHYGDHEKEIAQICFIFLTTHVISDYLAICLSDSGGDEHKRIVSSEAMKKEKHGCLVLVWEGCWALVIAE